MSNDSIKAAGSAVSSSRLNSGATVQQTPKKTEQSDSGSALDSVISEVGKAKDSVQKVAQAGQARIEVVKQNEAASQTKVSDVDTAVMLSKGLKLTIQSQPQEAAQAHDINREKAKDLLK